MRPERLTLQQAQAIWDDMRNNIALNGLKDKNGVKLPIIDMAGIFAGRRSMKWQDIGNAIGSIIAAWEPPLH